MKKVYYIILLFLSYGICVGQNLVPNYSFEVIDSCPTSHSQLMLANPWNMPANTSPATSDLFNACIIGVVGVPDNVCGYQNANTGVGYAGVYTYGINIREYLQVELLSPLNAGSVYLVGMKVNPSDFHGIAVDGLGIYISTGAISGSGGTDPLPYLPQISNPTFNFLSDTLGWTDVSGFYTATGGENYITIGNFLDDFSTNITTINSQGIGRGYYKIDDVTVSLATGIEDIHHQNNIEIYPNPFEERLNIKSNYTDDLEMTIYDLTSRNMIHTRFTNSVSLNTEQFGKGIYLYEIRNVNGVVKKGKVVKN